MSTLKSCKRKRFAFGRPHKFENEDYVREKSKTTMQESTITHQIRSSYSVAAIRFAS